MKIDGRPHDLEALRKAMGGSRFGATLTKKLATSDPHEALEQLRAVSAVLKAAEKNPKGFK